MTPTGEGESMERYDILAEIISERHDGEWVRYADHLATVKRLEAALRMLQNGPDTLTQAGLKIVNEALYPERPEDEEDRP